MDLRISVRVVMALTILGLTAIYPTASKADLVRGLENYLAILKGQKTIQQLSPEEAQEVLLIHSRLRGSGGGGTATGGYEIEASANDEWFVINGEKYQAQTYCFGFEQGDRVKFLEGSPYGACASAKLLNLRTNQICDVWCE
ncbi:MAG: hypothetical protein ACE5JU_21110 [Candidatus Binatia bacterium]